MSFKEEMFESIAPGSGESMLCPTGSSSKSLFKGWQVSVAILKDQNREEYRVVFIIMPSLRRFCSIANYRLDRDE